MTSKIYDLKPIHLKNDRSSGRLKSPNWRKTKMDSLIQQIVEKTGVSEEIAQTIVDMVLENVKGQLPANMQGMVDSFLGGGGDAGAGGGLGNMLGGFLKK